MAKSPSILAMRTHEQYEKGGIIKVIKAHNYILLVSLFDQNDLVVLGND